MSSVQPVTAAAPIYMQWYALRCLSRRRAGSCSSRADVLSLGQVLPDEEPFIRSGDAPRCRLSALHLLKQRMPKEGDQSGRLRAEKSSLGGYRAKSCHAHFCDRGLHSIGALTREMRI